MQLPGVINDNMAFTDLFHLIKYIPLTQFCQWMDNWAVLVMHAAVLAKLF